MRQVEEYPQVWRRWRLTSTWDTKTEFPPPPTGTLDDAARGTGRYGSSNWRDFIFTASNATGLVVNASSKWPATPGSLRRPKWVEFEFQCGTDAVRSGTYACIYQNNETGAAQRIAEQTSVLILGVGDGDGPQGSLVITLASSGKSLWYHPYHPGGKRYDDGRWHKVIMTSDARGRANIWVDDDHVLVNRVWPGDSFQLGNSTSLADVHGGGHRFKGTIRNVNEMTGDAPRVLQLPERQLWAMCGGQWTRVVHPHAHDATQWRTGNLHRADGAGTWQRLA